MAEIPKYGTPEYRWWCIGAKAEADARKERRSAAGLAVLDVVDALAEMRHDLTEVEIVEHAFEVFAAGLSLRQRAELAWKLVRG